MQSLVGQLLQLLGEAESPELLQQGPSVIALHDDQEDVAGRGMTETRGGAPHSVVEIAEGALGLKGNPSRGSNVCIGQVGGQPGG